jgi:hypothetical protein
VHHRGGTWGCVRLERVIAVVDAVDVRPVELVITDVELVLAQLRQQAPRCLVLMTVARWVRGVELGAEDGDDEADRIRRFLSAEIHAERALEARLHMGSHEDVVLCVAGNRIDVVVDLDL